MNEDAFKDALSAEGYSQIEVKTIEPRPANVQHAHDHDVRGLVLNGIFTVWTGNRAVSHHSGDVFDVPAGIPHSEEIGPDGAHVVIGRRWKA